MINAESNALPKVSVDCRRRTIAIVLMFLFALLPPIGIFAPLGVAPFLTITALAVALLEPRHYWRVIRHRRWFVLALAVVALWGALSALWSTLPGHSVFEGMRLLAIVASGLAAFAGFATLTSNERLTLARIVAISVIVTVAVFVVDDVVLDHPLLRYVTGRSPDQVIPLERFDRGTTVLGLIFWPIALALWSARRHMLLLSLIIATALALVLIPSTTNRIAAVLGLGVWFTALLLPRLTAALMAIGVVAFALVMPYAVSYELPTNEAVVSLHHHAPWIKFSALHRLLIWRFTSERIRERPWLGWGMDASRELPGGHDKLIDTLSEPIIPPLSDALPLHPHNAFLQWRVELGLPATLFCALVVALLLWRSGASGPTQVRAASLACAAVGLTIALLGYGVWQAWWMSTLWLAAALLARPFPARL